MIVVGEGEVLSEVIFCVEFEFGFRIGLLRQDFDIFEICAPKMAILKVRYRWLKN